MGVDGHRPRLVDELRAGGEFQDAHRPAAAVAVPGAAVAPGQRSRVPAVEEGRYENGPVPGEALEKLQGDLDPGVQLLGRQPGEDRVFVQDSEGGLGLAQPLDEGGEALLRRLPDEQALDPRHVQLQHQRPRQHRQQAIGERLGGQPFRLLD
jgi:hypothetical protein